MTNVTDAGLMHLLGLTELITLDLGGNYHVSDAGLVHIQGLTKLTTLELGFTEVTDAGVEKLQQVLPKCNINH